MKIACKVQWQLFIVIFLLELCDTQLRQDLAWFHALRDLNARIIGRSSREPKVLREAMRFNRIQEKVPLSTEFPCRFVGSKDAATNKKARRRLERTSNRIHDKELPRARSEVRPTSVHRLRPGDIDIVGAMGDSITAGNGAAASNILDVFTENRGMSWSIGGQGTWREYLTLPNVLKVFNPNLIGYSLEDAHGYHLATQFNIAEIAAMSRDIVYMAKELVKRLKRDRRVNMKSDWKLVTILIGPNDFCSDVCYRKSPFKVLERHRKDLLEALLVLKDNLPRTFVNLVPAPDVSEIFNKFKGRPPLCELTHALECPCLFGAQKHKYKETMEVAKRWQQIDIEMENAPELQDKDDFAVVLQPLDVEISLPTKRDGLTDFSLLSADCFHFSQKGLAWIANALWNNMLQPPGKKQRTWNGTFTNFLCPTADFPYLYTSKNSKGFRN